MKFVLVKDGTSIVGKEAYAGDDEANAILIKERQAKNSSVNYEEVDESTFAKSSITAVENKEQVDWQTAKAKGPDAAVIYIAEKLGLE